MLLAAMSVVPALALASPARAGSEESREVAVAVCNDHVACGALGCCLFHALGLGSSTDVPGAAGLRVERDFESGGFGVPSTPVVDFANAPELAMVSRETSDLVPVFLPGGGVQLLLNGRFQNFSMAMLRSDGRLQTGCEEDASGLLLWLRGQAPATGSAGWPEE